jgi:hypothetical protein
MSRVTEIPPADRDRIDELVCAMIDAAREHITSDASWRRLEQFFYEKLVANDATMVINICEWANAGHPAADHAIRRYVREMKYADRHRDLHYLLKGYDLLDRPFAPYPRGRHVVQNLMRDLWLSMVVQHVANGTGLAPTRSRSTTTPSASYFVSRAMRRRGFKLKEIQVNKIHWARNDLAARLEASMPAIPSPFK